jgi:hypothetical protein
MNKQTKSGLSFATVEKNGVITQIGKSYIATPKPLCKERDIKWFDDEKLRKGGDAIRNSQQIAEKSVNQNNKK